jgi:hypothetical protein
LFCYALNISQTENINILTLGSLIIPIKPSSTVGFFEADADIKWLQDGASWAYLLPNPPANRLVKYPDVEFGVSAITVASVSDTLSVRNNVATLTLTWIAIGFSVLLTQPIFEALLLKDCPQTTSTPSQGLWSQDRKGPKPQ